MRGSGPWRVEGFESQGFWLAMLGCLGLRVSGLSLFFYGCGLSATCTRHVPCVLL